MRVLVVGSGGVGAAVAAVAQRRGFFERMVLRGRRRGSRAPAVEPHGDDRASAPQRSTRPTRPRSRSSRARKRADAILNAVDPRFNPPIFQAAFDAGCTYLDMAMTLSHAETRREARRRPVRAGRSLGGGRPARARRHRRRAWPLRRLRPLRRATSSSPRSTRSGSATARISRSRATTSRRPSRSGRRSRSASTRR